MVFCIKILAVLGFNILWIVVWFCYLDSSYDPQGQIKECLQCVCVLNAVNIIVYIEISNLLAFYKDVVLHILSFFNVRLLSTSTI